MIVERLKRIVENHKTLIQNFSYLSALQVFNMLLPLVTYPYLIRVLGKETYGLIVFAQAVIGYLLIFVSFGFHISATKEVSIHRADKEKLSEIVSSVLIIKGILFVISLIVLSGLLYFIPKAHGYEILFFLTMWVCLYDFIFPIWYFQGIEKMKYITYLTLVSRLIFLGLIFIFINSADDYLLLPLISGIGAIVAGTLSLFIIFKTHKIKFCYQPIEKLVFYTKDSIPIFLSSISTRLYVSTNKVIVGAFIGIEDVAYYDLAEKITTLMKVPQQLFGQALFPKISKEKNKYFVKKIFKFSLLLNILIWIVTILFSKIIIQLLGGREMLSAVWVLNILAFTIPIVSMNNIFGVQLLIAFGYKKKFSQILITSGAVYLMLILLTWLTVDLNIYNITLITVLIEIFVTVYMFISCKKYNLW